MTTKQTQPNNELRGSDIAEIVRQGHIDCCAFMPELLAHIAELERERGALAHDAREAEGLLTETRQQIDELKEQLRLSKRQTELAAAELWNCPYKKRAESLEKQLAEARVQLNVKELYFRTHIGALEERIVNIEGIVQEWRLAHAAALERAAEGAQTVEAYEIHNRFCGENGEPCQVCRLKAEREEKK